MTVYSSDTSSKLLIQGTDGDDTLTSTTPYVHELLEGLAGDDVLETGPSGSGDLLLGGEGNDQLTGWSQSSAILDGGAGSDVITVKDGGDQSYERLIAAGGSGDDVLILEGWADADLFGEDGADQLIGQGGTGAVLNGGAGDDVITLVDDGPTSPGAAVTTMAGGTGNDIVQGSGRQDLYLFNRGDGEDQVDFGGTADEYSSYSHDKVQFGSGIQPWDVRKEIYTDGRVALAVYQDGEDIGDRIWVDGAEELEITYESAEFINEKLSQMASFYQGTDEDDVLTGEEGSFSLFQPGKGSDQIIGSSSLDRLLFNRGDGADEVHFNGSDGYYSYQLDAIAFGEGITPQDILVLQQDGNRVVRVLEEGVFNGDSITMIGIPAAILTFFDGTEVLLGDLPSMSLGTEGDDVIALTAGEDGGVFAGEGNDQITVAEGSNTGYVATQVAGEEGDDSILAPGDSNSTLLGGAGNDSIVVTEDQFYNRGQTFASGGAGDDLISAHAEATARLEGGAGNDRIEVTGDDISVYQADKLVIEGGTGDDEIVGNIGTEKLIFKRGDGNDTYTPNESTMSYYYPGSEDTIEFGEGISLEDISVRLDSSGAMKLFVQEAGLQTGDSITLNGFFDEMLTLKFVDGTSVSVLGLPLDTSGTEGDDYLVSQGPGAVLDGLGGNDKIYGSSMGTQLLNGGAGDDELYGVANTDTEMNGDAGSDLLVVSGQDSYGSELVIARGGDGDDRLIAEGKSGGQLEGGAGNDELQADAQSYSTLDGGDGNDTLTVVNSDSSSYPMGNVRLEGGKGEDLIVGSDLKETVTFNRGDGVDTVNLGGSAAEYSHYDRDTIEFGEGIYSHDLMRMVSAVDGTESLIVRENGQDVGDRIILQGNTDIVLKFFDSPEEELQYFPTILMGSDNDDVMVATSDYNTLDGGAGNDQLSAGTESGVVFDGGRGDDVITGSYDRDYLYYERGDGADTVDLMGGGYYRADKIYLLGDISDADLRVVNHGDGTKALQILHNGVEVGDQLLFTGSLDFELYLASTNTQVNLDDLAEFIPGTDGDDSLEIRAGSNAVLEAGAGNDQVTVTEAIHPDYDPVVVDGGAGNDILITHESAGAHLLGGEGDDQLTVSDTLPSSPIGGNTLDGGVGNDTLTALAGVDDRVIGGAGDDSIILNKIWRGGESTEIEGGLGNDTIYGSEEKEVVLFNRGDGKDSLIDMDGPGGSGRYHPKVDTIRFGEGISQGDLLVRYNATGVDVHVLDNGVDTGDCLSFSSVIREELEFADGSTVWLSDLPVDNTPTEGDDVLRGESMPVHGLGGNDTLTAEGYGLQQMYGDEGDDTLIAVGRMEAELYGGAGQDSLFASGGQSISLYGGEGDDVIVLNDDVAPAGATRTKISGGLGNDHITGSSRRDALLFERGDGEDRVNLGGADGGSYDQDEIHFGAGITMSDLQRIIHTDGTVDLEILQDGQYVGDRISLEGNLAIELWFEAGARQDLEWTPAVLRGGDEVDTLESSDEVFYLDGAGGDDLLTAGFNVGTHFIGGTGNDVIVGSAGVDSVFFARGDGVDTIDLQGSGYYRESIYLGEGISASDLQVVETVGQPGVRLNILQNGEVTGDAIIMNGTPPEDIYFADGGFIQLNDIPVIAEPVSGTAGDDQIYGTANSDILDGGAGNDLIDVTNLSGGFDTLIGGDGNDLLIANGGSNATLEGGNGNDVIELMESGEYGRVIVSGGTGTDFISGSSQGESFVFNRNDGADWIDDSRASYGEVDEIIFGNGITADDLQFFANPFNQDLTIAVRDNGQYTGDMITIAGGAMGGPAEIEQFAFADTSLVSLYDLWQG